MLAPAEPVHDGSLDAARAGGVLMHVRRQYRGAVTFSGLSIHPGGDGNPLLFGGRWDDVLRRMLSDANWAKPLRWNREAQEAGVPAKVFCASMADVFEDHPQVAEPRKRLWDLIERTPWLRWQLLTKRPENVDAMAPWGAMWPDHVWLGVSVENERYADERIPLLLDTCARVKFLSCEPLIGPVDLGIGDPHRGHESDDVHGYPHPRVCLTCTDPADGENGQWVEYFRREPDGSPFSWVICGGESGGPKRREMNPAWLASLARECQDAGVPIWVKQDSGPRSGMQGRIPDDLWALKQFPAEFPRSAEAVA